jgi:hypothetical protein
MFIKIPGQARDDGICRVVVIPAQAGILMRYTYRSVDFLALFFKIPACAGMTVWGGH